MSSVEVAVVVGLLVFVALVIPVGLRVLLSIAGAVVVLWLLWHAVVLPIYVYFKIRNAKCNTPKTKL